MFDLSGFDSGPAAVALTGAVLGWVLRPLFLRYRPAFFVAIAANDFLFNGQFGLIKSWYDAKKPVEFHLYQDGGHGFGMGYPGHPTYWWFEPFTHWLDHNGFLKAAAAK